MDHVVLRNDFGMDKKLGAVSGGLGIVRVMAAAWLFSVMISAVGMVLASLIFYAVGEGQNRIRVSVYVVVVLAVLIGGIYAGPDVWLPPGGSSVCLLCCFALAAGCWEECLDKRLLKKVRQFFSWNAERKIVVLHREWVGFSKKIEIISYNARIFLKRALKMQMSML